MKSYTVKVPDRWPTISSVQAGEWLRSYFVHPLSLPPDPGAGERILRLSLSGRLVGALAEGVGERPAPALRRLLAAHLHELPMRKEPRALLPMDVKTLALSVRGGPPSWFEPQAEAWYRREVWSRFPADYKAQLLGQSGASLAPVEGDALARVVKKASWASLLLPLIPLVGYVVLLHFAAARQSRASAPAQAAQFGAWVPE